MFAVLSPLADPHTTTPNNGTQAGQTNQSAATLPGTELPDAMLLGAALPAMPDERTAGQRLHDALQSLCTRQLRAGTLPGSGGTPCTVLVTVNLQDLITKTGHATTSTGILSIGELLDLATEAEIIPVFINNAGGIMGYGRTKRLFTPAQTKALTARDRGCSFPTCHTPPEWCQRHHIIPWINDGPTDIDNGTLVCNYHHHQALNDGWDCTMTTDKIPAWLPPPWLDPTRTPLTNPASTHHSSAETRPATASSYLPLKFRLQGPAGST